MLAYTNTYNSGSSSYATTAVVATGVAAACNGLAYQLTLSNGAASIGTSAGTVSLLSSSFTMTITPATVNAGSVTSVALVITG